MAAKKRSGPVEVFGIKHCDTMKKARSWLEAHGVAYVFHDYKAEGVSKENLETWIKELGWETVLNRAGTTFKALPDADKTGITPKKAVALMQAQPAMIKRPMLVRGGEVMAGFKPEIYAAFFDQQR